MSPALRPYQQHLLEQLAAAPDKRILIVCPTGGGKTVVAAALMASSSRRALMIAHRREIVNQTSAKLTAFGVHHGVIQAGDDDRLRPMAAVQVASIQTLHARAIRSATMTMPLADIVVIDEAHHSCAMTYQKVLAAYPHASVLGLTATPCRADGRGRRHLRHHHRGSASGGPDRAGLSRADALLCAGRSRSPRRENPSR